MWGANNAIPITRNYVIWLTLMLSGSSADTHWNEAREP
jgi:hypothetical protein